MTAVTIGNRSVAALVTNEGVILADGGAVMLTEHEIIAATFELARLGLYVEPTAAQPVAALAKLLEAMEVALDIENGALRFEIMIETTAAATCASAP